MHKGSPSRSGLTLLELVVVMAILAALAGIVIPLMPNMISKASSSSGATNLSETVKAVQLYAAQNGDQYPDNLDSIVDENGVIAGYVANAAVGGSGTSSTTLQLTPYTLNANDLAALNAVGIAHVTQMISATDLAGYQAQFPASATYSTAGTFNASTGLLLPNPVALAGPSTGGTGGTTTAGSTVAGVAGTVATQKFGVPATGTYIVFGLGQFASIVGNAINKAPVWINPAAGYDPNSKYARLGLVFQTADANGPLARAVLIGAVQFSGNGLLSQDDDMKNYSAQ
jgi:prepilin-type N-terminal cleavage/methylation domain-containing protein